MVKEEPTREVIRRLRKAGFTRSDAQGSHAKWIHPLGPWVALPDGHRTISPGVVRQVDQAIVEARGVAEEGGSDARIQDSDRA